MLREWFACEMGRLGVPDQYVDAFCGRCRAPCWQGRLKEIYDNAKLIVLS